MLYISFVFSFTLVLISCTHFPTSAFNPAHFFLALLKTLFLFYLFIYFCTIHTCVIEQWVHINTFLEPMMWRVEQLAQPVGWAILNRNVALLGCILCVHCSDSPVCINPVDARRGSNTWNDDGVLLPPSVWSGTVLKSRTGRLGPIEIILYFCRCSANIPPLVAFPPLEQCTQGLCISCVFRTLVSGCIVLGKGFL